MKHSKTTQYGIIFLTLGGLGAISLLIAYFNRVDAFVYIFGLWFLYCLALVFFFRTRRYKLTALYTGSVLIAFGLFEAYLCGWFSPPKKTYLVSTISDPDYYQTHPVLGTVPKKDIQVRASKIYKDEVVYDVDYTISKQGIRVGADIASDPAQPVLFFGGSFTFGEGVEDSETLPYQFEVKSKGKFDAINFGFHGYGPHQMLAILENEMERKVVGEKQPKWIVYQALGAHIQRCNGGSFWDQFGPKYALENDGSVTYKGAFQNWLMSRIIGLLGRSKTFVLFFNKLQKVGEKERDLFVGIVNQAARIFKERYDGEFSLIAWDNGADTSKQIFEKFKEKGIRVIKVSEILPDYFEKKAEYVLHPEFDRHPNAKAFSLIATYLNELEAQGF